jgi:hypothetical protein
LVASSVIGSEVTAVEVGYFVSTAVLAVMLWLVYRRGDTRGQSSPAASTIAA